MKQSKNIYESYSVKCLKGKQTEGYSFQLCSKWENDEFFWKDYFKFVSAGRNSGSIIQNNQHFYLVGEFKLFLLNFHILFKLIV